VAPFPLELRKTGATCWRGAPDGLLVPLSLILLGLGLPAVAWQVRPPSGASVRALEVVTTLFLAAGASASTAASMRARHRAGDVCFPVVMWKEFRDFIARGNVIDLAVGVIIGAAFGRIVTALVEGVLMPPIGLALGGIDFSSLFYVLDASKGVPISLADARAKGLPVIAYGQFINEIIAFLIVAFAVFLLVKQVNRIKSSMDQAPAAAPATKECAYCASTISIKATRCPHCTSTL